MVRLHGTDSQLGLRLHEGEVEGARYCGSMIRRGGDSALVAQVTEQEEGLEVIKEEEKGVKEGWRMVGGGGAA